MVKKYRRKRIIKKGAEELKTRRGKRLRDWEEDFLGGITGMGREVG